MENIFTDKVNTSIEFTVLGLDADYGTCDKCGKQYLNETVVLEDMDGNMFHIGTTCVVRLLRGKSNKPLTAKKVIAIATEMQREVWANAYQVAVQSHETYREFSHLRQGIMNRSEVLGFRRHRDTVLALMIAQEKEMLTRIIGDVLVSHPHLTTYIHQHAGIEVQDIARALKSA
jgi:hypothetical protein